VSVCCSSWTPYQELIGIGRRPVSGSWHALRGRLIQVLIRLERSGTVMHVVRMDVHLIRLVVDVGDLIIDSISHGIDRRRLRPLLLLSRKHVLWRLCWSLTLASIHIRLM